MSALAQPTAGVGKEQIHPSAVGDEMVLQRAAGWVLLLDIAQQPFEIGQIAVDRAMEIGLVLVAVGHLVEGGAALCRIDAAHHDAALAGAEARPDGGGGAGIERARDAVDVDDCSAGGAVLVLVRARQKIGERTSNAGVWRRW